MVNRKRNAPQHISQKDQTQKSWHYVRLQSTAVTTTSTTTTPSPSETTKEIDYFTALQVVNDIICKIESDEATSQPLKKRKTVQQSKVPPLDANLQQFINDCDFYVTVIVPGNRASSRKNDDLIVASLGQLSSEMCPARQWSVFPRFEAECWLYVSTKPTGRSFLYYEWQHINKNCPDCTEDTLQRNCTLHAVYYFIKSELNFALMMALRSKGKTSKVAVQLQLIDYSAEHVVIDVVLLKSALVIMSQLSDCPTYTFRREICTIMEHFYGIKTVPIDVNNAKDRRHSQDIEALYSAVKIYHSGEQIPDIVSNVQHEALCPTLSSYQVAAVRWMLAKEVNKQSLSEINALHPLYEELKTTDGCILFYNRYSGHLMLEKPMCQSLLPGGILADEMGLGKTVEVLACIVNHKRSSTEELLRKWIANDMLSEPLPLVTETKQQFQCICGCDEDDDFQVRVQCCKCRSWQHAECVKYDVENDVLEDLYFCPHCWISLPPYPSRATLIVSPASINHQWLEEIQKHIFDSSLKIFNYTGVHREGFVQPTFLADHDVVLMSYGTLRKEVDYVDLPHSNSDDGRRFRNPKRFMAIPSPLVAINWWRVCLDEAQMVEYAMTKTAEMALRLSAVNRWCVTGTPIQKSVDDLYGLLLFLGVDPYFVRKWWNSCLLEPYLRGHREPMHKVISRILWRTAKTDVLDQVNIPAQFEDITWLSFTPVEEHFYRRQHIDCSLAMSRHLRAYADLDAKLNTLDRRSLSQLLAPLLRLRQACCHPQVVRGQFVPIHRNTMTMDELLESLIKKVKSECEEAHRLYIASLNGLAAIHAIKEEWAEAADKYRQVLASARDLRPQIKTDKLPRLHALNNLAEILEAGHKGVPRATGDDSLRQQANELRLKYLEKCSTKVRGSHEVYTQATKSVHKVENSFSSKDAWWASIIDTVANSDSENALVERVKSDIRSVPVNSAVANRFRNSHGLKLVLNQQLTELHKWHTDVSKAVTALDERPTGDIINGAVDCHLRPINKVPEKCVYCVIHDLFNGYESKLFSFDENKNFIEEPSTADDALMGPRRRGTWADGVTERILKAVLLFARGCDKVERVWIEDGQTHIKLFEALKKEFRGLRGVWMQLRDQVSALDELNMANIRLRVRLADEPKPDLPQPDILEPSEVDHHRLKFASDRVVANNNLQKKLGQLLYLQNLSMSDYGKRGGSNPEPCPICQQVLGVEWSVLLCGHCFCVDCIRILVFDQNVGGRCHSVKCAVCRHVTAHGEISYVSTMDEVADDERTIGVNGSHSTKVEAVVRKVLQIKAKDPMTKILVFSTWDDVLKLLQYAFSQNDIKHCCLMSSNKFKHSLMNFKNDMEITALLLPVHSGANGLNLIEATHIILVEPILNQASELQAIGRIHRIGQTKTTTVHRFLVRRTIEERMHNVLKVQTLATTSSHSTEENCLTIRHLLDLFASEDV